MLCYLLHIISTYFVMLWFLSVFSGMESCHSLPFWWHRYVLFPGCIAQEWEVQNSTSHWIGRWCWTAVASLEMGVIRCFRGELYSYSRVCFFLFDTVLYMFKNCSDFSLTSLLWYTHLELIVLFQKIAKQDGGRCEMAVYALQCSNLKRILPVCTDWEVCCDLGYFFLWLLVCDPSFSFLFIASLLVSLL